MRISRGTIIFIVFSVVVFCASFLSFGISAYADQSVRGFAWSSNIGWLSFSSINCDANDDVRSDGVPASCPTAGSGVARYGVNVSGLSGDTTRTFSGFAWSPYIGWVSFNTSDLSGCPSGACSAQISNNAVVGWSKSIANNPGWSGWIHLANQTPAYGPLLGADSKFRGFSWGEAVIGWLKWDPNGGGVYLYSGSEMRVVKNGDGLVTSTPVGINCGSDCNESFTTGTSVTLSQTEATGYDFSSWGGAGASCGTQNSCVVTMGSSDTVVTVTFDPILEVIKSGNGTIISVPSGINCGTVCSKSYTSGTSVRLTATPDSGYEFSGWTGAGASCDKNPICTVTVSAYTTVRATFTSITGSLVVTKSGNGAVVSSDGRIVCGSSCQANYANGVQVTLRAEPDIYYEVGSWGGAGASCGHSTTCIVTVSGTTNVSVTFVQTPACRDRQDNDTDGRTDELDPGCHSDGTLDPLTYVPDDNDERDGLQIVGNPPSGGTQYKCSDNIDNDLDGKCDYGAPGTSKMCLNPVTGVVSLMPVDFPECNSSTKNSETVSGNVVEY